MSHYLGFVLSNSSIKEKYIEKRKDESSAAKQFEV